MSRQALGLIETVGYVTAVSAADAALKAADVRLTAVERVVGVAGSLGITIHLQGDVAAVSAAVQAGKEAGERVGRVVAVHVIPNAHSNVEEAILKRFALKPPEQEGSLPAVRGNPAPSGRPAGGFRRGGGARGPQGEAAMSGSAEHEHMQGGVQDGRSAGTD